MSKLTLLKVKLIQYKRTKSIALGIALADDICNWLSKELLKEPKKIVVKEG